MKKRKTNIALIALIGTLILSGCTTPQTPESAAYKTLGSTATLVEAARQSWVSYVTQQRTILTGQELASLEEDVARGSVIYGQYQQAMRTAKAAITAYRSSADQSSLSTALNVVAAASGEFIQLVRDIVSPAAPAPAIKK